MRERERERKKERERRKEKKEKEEETPVREVRFKKGHSWDNFTVAFWRAIWVYKLRYNKLVSASQTATSYASMPSC